MVITVYVRVCLIMNHELSSSKTVGVSAHEMVIAILVHDYLIMNHGTIVQQNSRGVST